MDTLEKTREKESPQNGKCDIETGACTVGSMHLDPETCNFYRETMRLLNEAGVPYLVGGAYALQRYTGIERHTKDFDIFIHESDLERTLQVFEQAGYKTEVPFPHWLGKAYHGDLFVDIIYSSGNGVAEVDEKWFDNAVEGEVLGMKAKLCPPEEILWSKAFVMERERYDGADVAHLLLACAKELDWKRVIRRFDGMWRVLFSYLTLFGFIYPSERNLIPEWVMRTMMRQMERELKSPPPKAPVCQGTLISRQQFLIDVEQRGFRDARLEPRGNMSPEEIDIWTEAIQTGK